MALHDVESCLARTIETVTEVNHFLKVCNVVGRLTFGLRTQSYCCYWGHKRFISLQEKDYVDFLSFGRIFLCFIFFPILYGQ